MVLSVRYSIVAKKSICKSELNRFLVRNIKAYSYEEVIRLWKKADGKIKLIKC